MSSSFLAVSGFWDVKNKYGESFYFNSFAKTLNVNIPYVIYTNYPELVNFRNQYPTIIESMDIDSFKTESYRGKFFTHPTHAPSIELLMIWNEKMNLLKKAREKYDYEWYVWIDAGLSSLRDRNLSGNPWPNTNLDKLNSKTLNFCSSIVDFDDSNDLIKNYYHYISGGIYLIHQSMINQFFDLYYEALEYLLNQSSVENNWKYTDQCVWTFVYKNNKSLFNKLCHDYGASVFYLDKK